MYGFIAVLLLLVAPAGWASCPAQLLAADIAALPGQRTVLGCRSDDPERPTQCDWRTTVQTDARIGAVRRLLLLDSEHETGSGSRQHLAVYGCVGGKPAAVLELDYTNGARVEQMNAGNIVVVSGAWATGDPLCCPTAELHQEFVWSPSQSRYVLQQSARVPRE